MDDNTVLRLGSSLCHPHTCQHCGADVDQLATHGLSCKKSEGPIVWNTTCPDTLARSYHHQATIRAGAVADLAEERKTDKYSSLGAGYSFTPVATETLGAMGKRSLAFVRELGHRVMQCTGEVKARTYLLQHLSIALQRGNAVSVMGSVGGWSELDLFCV